MADTPQKLSLVALAARLKSIVRQKNRESATFFLLNKVRGSGKNVSWVAENSGIHTGAASETADISDFGSDTQDTCTLQWGLRFASFRISDLALAASRSSLEPAGNLNLAGRNIINASAELTSDINGLVVQSGSGSAGSTNAHATLHEVIGSTDDVYAGVDRSSKTFLNPGVVDFSDGAAITLDDIRADLAAIKVASGRRPQLMACHPSVFNRIAGLQEGKRRFVQDVRSGGQVVLGDTNGIPAVFIDGCMAYEDVDGYFDSSSAEGSIYYINRDHVRLEYLPMPEAPAGFFDLDVSATDMISVGDTGYYIAPLSRTGMHKKWAMFSMMQLVVDRPNACGARHRVGTASALYSS